MILDIAKIQHVCVKWVHEDMEKMPPSIIKYQLGKFPTAIVLVACLMTRTTDWLPTFKKASRSASLSTKKRFRQEVRGVKGNVERDEGEPGEGGRRGQSGGHDQGGDVNN